MTGGGADVVVLGAGPAGLGAAWRLARTGRSVVVLEREPVVGGLSASFEVAGLRVDHGSHRLHPATDPVVLDALRGLLGDELQLRPRHGRIRMAGSFVAFPPSPAGLLRALPPALSARLARDLVTSPLRHARHARSARRARHDERDTFAEVVRASLGPTLLDAFYGPFVAKLWGLPPDALDGELARRRVGARRPSDLVRKVVRRAPQGNVFWYPERGYGRICEVLADAAVAAGARIECNAAVERIAVRADDVAVVAGGREYVGGAVWSTLPLPLLARLAGGPASALGFRGLTLVYLALDRPQWTEFDAHYLPEPSVPVSRISEPRNYRDSAHDPADRTVLCAEWPCTVGDETWSAPAAVLVDRLRAATARESLPIPEPVAVEVRRVPNAYPVYDLGFAARFAELDEWARTREPRLLTFGRQGLFAHDNAHHALASAFAATDAMRTDGSFDAVSWRAARVRFAQHVVED